nr:MAG TPA: hypothetical protein [Caudoviricetes sp.]
MGLAIIKYLHIFWIHDCTYIIARKLQESNLFFMYYKLHYSDIDRI